MAIQTRLIEYTHGDLVLEGLLAWDDAVSGARPALAVSHAWGGRSDFENNKAIALAELGYVGFAIDMYGKGKSGSSVEECTALMTPVVSDRPLLQERINTAITVLREQPEVDAAKVGAVGFCFGGLCVLDLARSGADVLGVVSFHGLLNGPGNTQAVSAKVLCLHGYSDPMANPDSLLEFGQEMTDAGADWQVHAYGNTLHAFTNPEANDPELGMVYSELADKRSWIAMQSFLEEVFA